jgi:DnaJ-class molecular chaperone
MPKKGSDARGDLYLRTEVEFPENGWCLEVSELNAIQNILPNKPRAPLNISPKEIDDVDYLKNASPPDDEDEHSPDDSHDSDDEYNYGSAGGPPECTTV